MPHDQTSELGSQRSEISPLLSVSLDSLKPIVQKYALNLRSQILTIFKETQVSNYQEFKTKALSSPNTIPREIIEKLQTLLKELQTVLQTNNLPPSETHFIIPNAKNPYHEALVASGISTPETQDIEINLQTLLEQDKALYTAQGLSEWAEALEDALQHLDLTQEARQLLETQIQEGAIPIFMPAASIQRKTLLKAFQTLKPLWIEVGIREPLHNPNLIWDHLKDLITTNHPSLTQDIPDHPYLLLVKPTQAPDPSTCTQTLDQQKAYLQVLQQTNPHLHSLLPQEYVALQAIFTSRLQQQQDPAHPLTTLKPIDYDTWTRFITLPSSFDGSVPGGDFITGSRRLRFFRSNPEDSVARLGFRPVMRYSV